MKKPVKIILALGAAIALGMPMFGGVYAAAAVKAPPYLEAYASDGIRNVKIYPAPCTDKRVLLLIEQNIKPEYQKGFHAAVGHTGERVWAACWRVVSDGILVISRDGSAVVLPVTDFYPPGIKPSPKAPKETPGMI